MRRWHWLSLLGAFGAVGFFLALAHWFLARPYQSTPSDAPAPADWQRHAALDAPKPLTVLEPAFDQAVVATPSFARHRVRRHQTPPLTDTKNYLFIGLDRRPGARYGGLADTIIIAVLDENSGHMGLVSVPRDLYVEIPGHGPDRINATLGLARQIGERPLPLLKRVIEDTLALPIAHALSIDLGVFERAVDALDGVEVEVPCSMIDNFLDARTSTGWRRLEVSAGIEHMDGVTAAMYVRSRHGRSDWSRSRRQQAVLFGMRERFLSLGGFAALPSLWADFENSIATDMRRVDVFRLARKAAGTDRTKIHGLVLGEKQTTSFRTEDGRSVLLPNYEAIDEALEALFKSPAPGTLPKHAKCEPPDAALRSKNAKKENLPQEGG
jgi:LCP family protein required for cell wall assembly